MPDQTMLTRMSQSVLQHQLLQNGDVVVVALSGGADSVALFHLLLQYAKTMSLTILAAHINHGLRKEESNSEEAFVVHLCKENRVPLFIEHANMTQKPRPKGLGIEAWARELRYSFFRQLATQYNAKIATGHTASDDAETVLFHAIRGSFTAGLRGILPKRGPYIRPLLSFSRQEIRAYCKTQGYAYCLDSSNEDTSYTRNFLRLSVLPQLEEIHPGAQQNLHRLARDMQDLHMFLQSEAQQLLQMARQKAKESESCPGWYLPGYDANTLRLAPKPVCKQAFALLAGKNVNRAYLNSMEAVLQKEQKTAQLPNFRSVRLQGERFLIHSQKTAQITLPSLPLQEGKFLLNGGYHITVSILSMQASKQTLEIYQKKDYIFLADYDKINQSCSFRTRCSGDVFCPIGRGVHKSVKKWMQEAGIDRELRDDLPLLANREQVLWIYGAGFANGLEMQADTNLVLCIETRYQKTEVAL